MFKTAVAIAALLIASSSASFAEGNIKAGKKVFKKCGACHTVKEGKHKSGPSLYNIIGQKMGITEDYDYSEAMQSIDLIWDEETFTAFVTKPKDVVPETKMAFAGLKKEKQIVDLLAYIKSVAEK